MATHKFSLGKTVMTKGVANLLDGLEISLLLARHLIGDWGDLTMEDKQSNESALATGNQRIFSAYKTAKGKIWVITEYDFSTTTVLLPEEY